MSPTATTLALLLATVLLAVLPVARSQECESLLNCSSCANIKFNGHDLQCAWCNDIKACVKQEKLGCNGACNDKQCRVGTCSLDRSTLLYIVVPCVCVGVLFIIILWVYCCCCRSSSSKLKTWSYKEDKKEARKRFQREEAQHERRRERESQNDAIRQKYGLKQSLLEEEDDIII